MQNKYTYEDHMVIFPVITELYCYQSEEELGQNIDLFWIEYEILWSGTGSFVTSYIWKSIAIKDGKSYM